MIIQIIALKNAFRAFNFIYICCRAAIGAARNLQPMKHIAIFASGNGSNAENIINFFAGKASATVSCVLTNNADAPVAGKARRAGVPCLAFDRKAFDDGTQICRFLDLHRADYVVLAGFLWLVPGYLTDRFEGRIVNIHPALLPKFGGRGMYGMHVHRAVIEAGEKRSGITVHEVSRRYDEGRIICSVECAVMPDDTPESLAERIHGLEHKWFPTIIENEIEKLAAAE